MIARLARLHWSLRLLAGAAFGLLTATGFAPLNAWPLTIFGIAGLTLCVATARRWWLALGIGYAYGVGFFSLAVGWLYVLFVQAMVALVLIEATFSALLALLIWAVRKAPWWPVTAALSWVIVEFVFSRFPADGFGWARIGYSMVDSPLAIGLPVFGVAGLTFLTALVGQTVSWFAEEHSPRRALGALGIVALCGIVSATGLLVTPGPATGSVAAGWVQGGAPGGGVFGLGPARTITTHQAAETDQLMQRVRAGQLQKPDFIVWPENSTDMDPNYDVPTAVLIQGALAATRVPIIVGSVPLGPGADERQTVAWWWDPSSGVGDRYAKRGVVPFGEWIPFRDLLLPLINELKYVGPQTVPGTDPGVITGQLADGRHVRVGILICYDLIFDKYTADTITSGAQVMVVQSSNAMFQGTTQIDQQFAITRVRAMETRREFLVVTTSGVSGLINPDGTVVFRTTTNGPASGVVQLPLRNAVTPAALAGSWIEGALVFLGLLGIVVGWRYGRMAPSKKKSGAKNG